MTKQEDNLTRRKTNWKMTSTEDNLTEKQPKQKIWPQQKLEAYAQPNSISVLLFSGKNLQTVPVQKTKSSISAFE